MSRYKRIPVKESVWREVGQRKRIDESWSELLERLNEAAPREKESIDA